MHEHIICSKCVYCEVKYERYGRAAPIVRNKKIGNFQKGLYFWDEMWYHVGWIKNIFKKLSSDDDLAKKLPIVPEEMKRKANLITKKPIIPSDGEVLENKKLILSDKFHC